MGSQKGAESRCIKNPKKATSPRIESITTEATEATEVEGVLLASEPPRN